MATAEEYAAWIVQNADKRGTPQFDTVARAYQDAKSKLKVVGRSARAPDALDDPNMAVAGNSFGQNLLEGIGSGLNSVKQALTFAPKAEVEETKALNAPLSSTAGGTIGNIAGNVAAAAPAAFIPGANTMLGATMIGGVTGGLLTPGDLNDRTTGAALGVAGGFAGQAVPRVFSAAKAAAEPFTETGRNAIIGRVMNRAAGDNADDVARRMALAKELVPGSAPTAAEVAESGGIAALQRAMSAADPEAYAHRGMEQSSARLNALRGIAVDDASLLAATKARDEAASSLYGKAFQSDAMRRDLAAKAAADRAPFTGVGLSKNVDDLATPGLRALANRPMFKSAVDQAKTLAANKGVMLDDPLKSLEGLHYVKLALDDMLNPQASSAMGRNASSAVMDMRAKLTDELATISPLYGNARSAYADMSKPINKMEVGKALLDKLQGPLSDHGALANETGATLARALRNEGETVARNATGFRQGIGDVLDPQQMGTVQAIAQDLARKSNAQNLGRGPGSNTFQNFAMDNLAEQGGMPSAVKSALGNIPGLSPTATLISKGVGAVGNMAYKSADETMRKSMAQALLNPQQAASLMEAAGKPKLLARALSQLPKKVTDRIPPEDILKLLQAAPGVSGAAALPAYLQQ